MRASRENAKPTLLRRALACLVSAAMVVAFTPVVAWGAEPEGVSYTALEGTGQKDTAEGYAKLLDGDTSTKWCVTSFSSAYIIFETSSSINVSGYSITTANDNAEYKGRNPKTWTLYGSQTQLAKDDSGWQEIHAVPADTMLEDKNYTKYDFLFTQKETPYQYFKLEITAIQSGTAMQMSEFALIDCNHNFSTVITPKTCTTAGFKTTTCDNCKRVMVHEIEQPLHHDFSSASGTCSHCGKAKTEFYYYLDADGKKADCPYTPSSVTSVTQWHDSSDSHGWYLVDEDLTISSDVAVSGDVHLILMDACKLTIDGGINVGGSDSLTVYGQSEPELDTDGKPALSNATGQLTANGSASDFGIGGGGAITINGGVVNATGEHGAGIAAGAVAINGGAVTASGTYGAGIGDVGDRNTGTNNGTVAITGGTVAASSTYGAGIGGGGGRGDNSQSHSGGDGGTITIAGGTVTATSVHGAGIGGGCGSINEWDGQGKGGDGGTIAIAGGTVTATSVHGAGIGGGRSGVREGKGGSGGTIGITGGTVTATSEHGAGIGGGRSGQREGDGGDGGTVIVSGGSVKGAGSDAVAIGGGYDWNKVRASGGILIITGGTFANSYNHNATAGIEPKPGDSTILNSFGNLTLPVDLTIPSDKTLEIGSGEMFTIASGVTLTNNGTITIEQVDTQNGTMVIEQGATQNGTLANRGSIYVDGTLSGVVSGTGAVYYPLTLNAGDGTINVTGDTSKKPGDTTTTYGKAGGTVKLEPVAKTGYKFDKWSVTSGGEPTLNEAGSYDYSMPNAAVTITAAWTIKQYTITFESNGGSIVDPITQDYNTVVTKPTDPTKDGYTFAGWYSDAELSQPYAFTTMPVDGIKLYAKWLSRDTSVQKVVVKGVDGVIDNANHTVTATLPYNVALPTQDSDFVITPAQGALVTTQPVKEGGVWKFTVTAEDSAYSAEYIVTVKQQPAPYVPPSDPSYNVPSAGEGGVAVKVTVSGSTAVVAEISASALESAAGSGAASITIDLSGLPKGVTQAQLSKSTVDKLLAVVSDAGNAVESVTVNLGGAVLTIDAKALAAVAEQVKGANVTLGVAESKADSLNNAQQKALSPFEVVQLYFDAQIKSGGVEIHDFGGGSVRVSVAFEPLAGHNPARYVVLYVGEDGTLERYATAWADGMLSFMAPHFSAYAVVYVEDATQAAIDALTALPQADELKAADAKEAVAQAQAALAEVAKLDAGQRSLVDEALVTGAEEVVARGTALIEEAEKAAAEAAANKAEADAKAVKKVKNKSFSVKAGKKKVIYFKTTSSSAGTKVTFAKTKGSKYISVTKAGKVTAKKGMKKGKTYTAKVKVTCGASSKTVTVTVRVR